MYTLPYSILSRLVYFLSRFSRGASSALFVKGTPLLAPGFTHPPHFPLLPPTPRTIAQDVLSFNKYAYHKLRLVSGPSTSEQNTSHTHLTRFFRVITNYIP
jgi:hypothetical protein